MNWNKKRKNIYLREPPGELTKSLISLVGSWASSNRSWLIMASATKSSIWLPKKTILSLRRRPMASPSAPRMAVAGVWGEEDKCTCWCCSGSARVLANNFGVLREEMGLKERENELERSEEVGLEIENNWGDNGEESESKSMLSLRNLNKLWER